MGYVAPKVEPLLSWPLRTRNVQTLALLWIGANLRDQRRERGNDSRAIRLDVVPVAAEEPPRLPEEQDRQPRLGAKPKRAGNPYGSRWSSEGKDYRRVGTVAAEQAQRAAVNRAGARAEADAESHHAPRLCGRAQRQLAAQ